MSKSDLRVAVAGKCTNPRPRAHHCPSSTARPGRRTCAGAACSTRLSQYNPGDYCVTHEHLEQAPIYPVVWHRNHVGARIEDVQALLHEHDHGLERTAYAHRVGLNDRSLYALMRGTNTRGRPGKLITPPVLERILSGLGLDHERHRWECLV